jgi:hypothetical protein
LTHIFRTEPASCSGLAITEKLRCAKRILIDEPDKERVPRCWHRGRFFLLVLAAR